MSLRYPPAPLMCSTPFGIRGSDTGTDANGVVGRFAVLNAFRHQRFGHVGRRALPAVARRVLNAFRHQRFGHDLSLRYPPAPLMCSTPFGIRGSDTGTIKQRLHSARKCSTPFGIRGSDTDAPCGHFRKQHVRVLNAFRHQRFGHTMRGALPDCDWMCSTPFGIRGSDTPALPNGSCAVCCAQRLSASEVRTPVGFVIEERRGIGGAQRLSASEVRTHAPTVQQVHRSWLCSTPFGIRGSDTTARRCRVAFS